MNILRPTSIKSEPDLSNILQSRGGACTVHVNNQAVRSCSVPIKSVEGAKITTIEGLGTPQRPHPIQEAWIDIQVPQCGYCQSGMQMAVAALLKENPNPSDEDINAHISNICRCGCYGRIRKAIHDAAKKIREEP